MSQDKERGQSNYIIVNTFDEFGVSEFKSSFDRLRGAQFPIVPVYIDSFGGEIYSLLAMIDIIESSDIPVATIAMGKAMSAGSFLLACGTPGLRFIGRNATVMIHDAASFSFGKIEDLKANVKETDRLNNNIFELIAEKCGHKDKDYFKKLIAEKKHCDWFMNADEAKKHKLVDHIGLPVLDAQYHIHVPKIDLVSKDALSKVKKK